MNSVLDENFELEELLEAGVLSDVIDAYGKSFGMGVRVLDLTGKELISCVRAPNFCETIHNSTIAKKCVDLEKKFVNLPIEGNQLVEFRSHCGFKYVMFNLVYQLEPLGRAVAGPFREPETTPETVLKVIQDAGLPLTEKDVQAIPALSPGQLKTAISLLVNIFNAFLFVNAKRMITTRLHLETIYSSRDRIFREVELQNSGSSADKEEIEKLKNMF